MSAPLRGTAARFVPRFVADRRVPATVPRTRRQAGDALGDGAPACHALPALSFVRTNDIGRPGIAGAEQDALREGMRRRLVRAALAVVAEHGVAGLTNRRVAAAAGVSLGSLTYHFRSQTDLLREALQTFVDDEARRMDALARDLGGSVRSVAEAAAAAERALGEMAIGREQLGIFEVHLQSARDPQLREAVTRCFAAYDAMAATVLRLLGVADAERIAPHVVALVAGAQLRRVATGESARPGTAEGLVLLLAGAEWSGQPS